MTSAKTRAQTLHPGSRSAQLAAELGRRIVGQVYPPASVLPPEASLLQEFGISRTVLRDAIKSLESKGLLQARQRVGTAVTPSAEWNMLDAEVLAWVAQSGADPDFLIRLTELRQIVEPGACALAAQKADAAAMQRLESAWARMVAAAAADDPSAFVAADRDFHIALLLAADNPYLASICAAIAAALTISLQHTNSTVARNRASLVTHERIVVSLRQRDGQAAAEHSRAQLDEAMQRLRPTKAATRPTTKSRKR